MFKVLRQIRDSLCRIINMTDHVVEAGEYQTRILRNTSKFDCLKKQATLEEDMEIYQKEIASRKKATTKPVSK